MVSDSASTAATMLMAIESSCMSVPLVHGARGKRGLAETDAAVVGRDRTICPDLEPALHQRLEVVEQQRVLENAAREYDDVSVEALGHIGDRVAQTDCERVLERARDLGHLAAAPPILHDRFDQRAEVEFTPIERDWVR